MPRRLGSGTTLSRTGGLGLLAAAAMIVASTAPAFAVCAICSAAVRFDKSLATCFAERFDDLSSKAAEKRSFIIVNLSDCQMRDVGALPVGATTPAKLDSSFVADDASLTCLRQAVEANSDKLDPSFLFDLTQLCP